MLLSDRIIFLQTADLAAGKPLPLQHLAFTDSCNETKQDGL